MKLFTPSEWTLNHKLAVAALVLGALAVAGDPYGGGQVTVDNRELARIVQDEVDHVTAPQLADWILAGRSDVRILDLRDEASYAAYHVPGAERVPITELADYPLYRNEPIVLYSDGGIHSAQGWFLLRAEGYAGASILLGGLDAWKDEVLFPVVTDDLEPAVAARLREVSEHFGGQPRGAGAANDDATYEMPEVAMPAAPVAPPPSAKRKKKEGC
jgi:rhodanese-related sulfurtransferase